MTYYNCVILESSYIIRKGLVSFFKEFKHIQLIFDTDSTEILEDYINKNTIHIVVYSKEFKELFLSKQFLLAYELEHDDKKRDGGNILNILKTKDHIIQKISTDIENILPPKEKDNKSLSEREIAVLSLVAQGKTNKEIADQLFISTHTVITHRKNITQKLGIKTISGLTMYALINNLTDTIPLK